MVHKLTVATIIALVACAAAKPASYDSGDSISLAINNDESVDGVIVSDTAPWAPWGASWRDDAPWARYGPWADYGNWGGYGPWVGPAIAAASPASLSILDTTLTPLNAGISLGTISALNPGLPLLNGGIAAVNPGVSILNTGLASINPGLSLLNTGLAVNPSLSLLLNPWLYSLNTRLSLLNQGLPLLSPGLAPIVPGLAPLVPGLAPLNPGLALLNPGFFPDSLPESLSLQGSPSINDIDVTSIDKTDVAINVAQPSY